MTKKHIKWPSINQYRHLIGQLQFKAQYTGKLIDGKPVLDNTKTIPPLDFKGTVKLHGSNLSIVYDFKFQEEWLQSRENIITNEDKSNWMAYDFYIARQDAFKQLAISLSGTAAGQDLYNKAKSVGQGEPDFVIFGEHCGKGIQKKCAIHQLDHFYSIFAVGYTNVLDDVPADQDPRRYFFLPDDIVVPLVSKLNDLRVFHVDQFGTFNIKFDFSDPNAVLAQMQELTAQVEKQCPAGTFFGVTGIGEGIVWRCQEPSMNNSRYWVKIKGDAHKVSKFKENVKTNPDDFKDLIDFSDKVITEARLEQGLSYLDTMGLTHTEDNTGTFLQWIVNDVLKEEGDRVVESNIDVKKLKKVLGTQARTWYLEKVKNIDYSSDLSGLSM